MRETNGELLAVRNRQTEQHITAAKIRDHKPVRDWEKQQQREQPEEKQEGRRALSAAPLGFLSCGSYRFCHKERPMLNR